MNKQQIKQILEEEADLDKAVEQILDLCKTKLPTSDGSEPKLAKSTANKLEYEILSVKYSERIYKLSSDKSTFICGGGRISQDTFNSGEITAYTLVAIIDSGSMRVMDSWRKVVTKTPLFKTEDGVDVYDGDFIQALNFKKWALTDHKTKIDRFCKQDEAKNLGYLWFSTKQAAENYVKCNKPCLSFNDVWLLNPSSKQSDLTETRLINKSSLTKLVKSKLN